MNETFIEIHALLEAIQQDSANPVEVRQNLRHWTQGVISGGVVVLGAGHGALSAPLVCDWLVDALDIVFRKELITAVEDYVTSYFDKGTARLEEDAVGLANMIGVSREVLEGREIFHRIATYCRDALVVGSQAPIEVKVEAAKFLLDAGYVGDDPEFWKGIWRCNDREIALLPTVVQALLEKWPSMGLEFLLAEATALPVGEQAFLANFVSVAWEDVTSRATADDYIDSFARYGDQVGQDLRSALQAVAKLRGWRLPDGRERASDEVRESAGSLVPSDTGRAPIWDIADLRSGTPNPASQRESVRQRAAWLAQELHFMEKAHPTGNGATSFPERQREMLSEISSARRGNPETAPLLGSLELGFVREAVRIEIDENMERSEFPEAEVLLDAVEACLPHTYYAQQAQKCLVGLGFSNRPFYLGASEYHQDRLLMSVVAASLRRAGLMGAQVARRPWDDRSLRLLGRESTDAHLVMRGGLEAFPTSAGILRFGGFRVFVRVDALRRHLEREDVEIAQEMGRLVEAAELGSGVRKALDVATRARLVLHLGRLTAKGSAFEDLRSATEKIAGVVSKSRRAATVMSNDEAFENFITGRSAIYCGGAINSLLLDTWWAKVDVGNFIEILSHSEIEMGFATEPAGRPRYVENALEFGRLGDHSEARKVRAAQKAIISLCRCVGQGLQTWSNDVMADPSHLNGSTRSCEAARRILRPLPRHRTGQYAFATTPTDAARLIKQSDTFYTIEGGLPN